METWHLLGICVIFMILMIAIGAMNKTFKNTNTKTPQVGNQILFVISCMIAGILLYFNHGLISYILLCFFVFIFFV
jgi:hypothetical protein